MKLKSDATTNRDIAEGRDYAKGQVAAKEAIWYRRCSLYSLTKYSAIFAEVKGYFGIDGCNNQLAGKVWSCSRSLRFRLNNQLGFGTVVNNQR
jgi:hypothetical protein